MSRRSRRIVCTVVVRAGVFLAAALATAGCASAPAPVVTRLPPTGPLVIVEPTSTQTAEPTPGLSVTPSPTLTPGALPTTPPSDSSGDAVMCDGGPRTIDGNERSVRVEGECSELTVSGSAISVSGENARIGSLLINGDRVRIDVAFVQDVVVQGNDGAVTVASGVPSLSVSGDRSTVRSGGTIGDVRIRGQDNVVRAGGTIGTSDVQGRGNDLG